MMRCESVTTTMSATSHRLQTSAWVKTRRYVLDRDAWLCRVPTERGECLRPASHCGHVVARADGGTDEPTNLRAECAKHSTRDGGRMGGKRKAELDARGRAALAILQAEGRMNEVGANEKVNENAPNFFDRETEHPHANREHTSPEQASEHVDGPHSPSPFTQIDDDDIPIFTRDVTPIDDPVGMAADDPTWLEGCPWLSDLLPVPAEATWPRVMSGPHARAVGTLGPEFAGWCERRTGVPLRWWQRLVSYRLLEHDADGVLIWETLLLTLARQLGKSWWLRELCLWRIHQGARFGEEQLVLHTGKDVNICKEVQRPARRWAREQPGAFKVREVNGQEEIVNLADDSRWLIRARDAVYGYSVSLAAVDEGWKVLASVVDEGIEPTMTEREQAQLVLISTAHRRATTLMTSRRSIGLDTLAEPAELLLIEWSAPRGCDLDDRAGWRAASPHWSPKRERLIATRLTQALEGAIDDPDEPDPLEAFRAQWLNQWPVRGPRLFTTPDEPLLAPGVWQAAAEGELEPDEGTLTLAVEDWYGHGAAAAACGTSADGRLLVGGWTFERWADAFRWVSQWCELRPGCRVLVGASLVGDPALRDISAPVAPVGRAQTAPALALLREMLAAGALVHDGSPDLAAQVVEARVTPGVGGLRLGTARSDLLRCAAWAVHSAVTSPSPDVAIF